jgi:circadian clock protein KaiB
MEKPAPPPAVSPSANGGPRRYRLCLYVAGDTQKSERAVLATRALCDQVLRDSYDLRVVDVFRYPELADRHRLPCVPALVREDPAPCRRVIGELDSAERLRELLEPGAGETQS